MGEGGSQIKFTKDKQDQHLGIIQLYKYSKRQKIGSIEKLMNKYLTLDFCKTFQTSVSH